MFDDSSGSPSVPAITFHAMTDAKSKTVLTDSVIFPLEKAANIPKDSTNGLRGELLSPLDCLAEHLPQSVRMHHSEHLDLARHFEIVPKCEQILQQQSPIHHHHPSGGR